MSVGISGYRPFYSQTSVIAVKAICPLSSDQSEPRLEEARLELGSFFLAFYSLIYQTANGNCLPRVRKVPLLALPPKEQWMNWCTKKGRGVAGIDHDAHDTHCRDHLSGPPQRSTGGSHGGHCFSFKVGFEVDVSIGGRDISGWPCRWPWLDLASLVTSSLAPRYWYITEAVKSWPWSCRQCISWLLPDIAASGISPHLKSVAFSLHLLPLNS